MALLTIFGSIIAGASSVLTIVGFAQSNIPSHSYPQTSVRVHVGLNGYQGLDGAEGEYPFVELWNANNQKIGDNWSQFSPNGFPSPNTPSIPTGTFRDVMINSKGQQATYLELHGGDNAICMAYVSVVWPDGQAFGFSGNSFESCNIPW
jgi:hypothetical protein